MTGERSLRVEETAARLRQRLAELTGDATRSFPAVAVPYRVCPIGAHIDHQGGPVLGMAIDAYTVLAFAPSRDGECRFASANFAGEASFSLERLGESLPEGFGRYAAAAAAALLPQVPGRPRGVVGVLEGDLPGAGLSSSASALLAYLTAFAEVNEIELGPVELVERTRLAENRFVGVQSGILDPASIVASRRGHLVSIDTRRSSWEQIAPGPLARPTRFLVAFSGQERNLAATGFNERVEQCRRAARDLASRTGAPTSERLGDLPEASLEALVEDLPEPERRRARHFVEERARVRRGVQAWQRGDLAEFGALMTDSCRSSIENFEVGSPPLLRLQEILQSTPGVLGSRFSGAGFGGCAIALVDEATAEEGRARVAARFREAWPELGERARFFLVESEDGIRRL